MLNHDWIQTNNRSCITIIWRFKEATPFSINANPSIDEVAGVGSKEATEIFLNKKVYFYHMR